MGRRIDSKTAEFTGGMPGGTDIVSAANSQNKFSCKFAGSGNLTAKCAVNSVGMDANGQINLDIELN
jgi:hypothetical protein